MSFISRLFGVAASIFAASSVVIGAFAAHALKDKLLEKHLTTIDTAVEYQFIHALALLLVCILVKDKPNKLLVSVGSLFITGTLFFSGSLYILSLTELRWVVFFTPLGGLCFICAWLLLLVNFCRAKAA